MYPKPLCYPKTLRLLRRKRLTLIGAFKTCDGVVLFADGQETVADHGKWEVQKIYLWESPGLFRVFMTGCGDTRGIEMIWEKVFTTLRDDLWTAPGGLVRIRSTKDITALIERTVSQITKKSIFPSPGRDKPYVDALWVIQHLTEKSLDPVVALFTDRLFVTTINDFHFVGSNLVLPQYISDLFGIHKVLHTLEDGEALAAFLLMEVKAYDPNVGKQSDIIVIGRNGSMRWVDKRDIRFWEDHFLEYKTATQNMLRSSSSPSLKGAPFPDQLSRVSQRLIELQQIQERMRADRKKRIEAEEEALKRHMCKR